MNNENFEMKLNAWVDGELSPDEVQVFEAELAANPALKQEAELLQQLLADAKDLPREIQPDHNLWQGIAKQIEAPAENLHGNNRMVWFSSVIAVAAMVLLAISLFYQVMPTQQNGGRAGDPVDELAAGSLALREADGQYLKARNELMKSITDRETPLSETTMAVLDENMAIIDGAVGEIRQAMLEDPNNPRLLDMFMATRSKELALLEDMVRLPEGV